MKRREFIVKLLKVAATSGVYPVLSFAEQLKISTVNGLKEAKKYITGCMWCQNGCSMIIYVKNNRVVHLTGNPDDPVTKGRICIKPYGSLELLTSPYRLIYPLKRINGRGEKAKLVRISIRQALDEITSKLKELHKKYGGECLGVWASGRSAADSRYLNKAFAKLYGTNNWEKTGPFCNYSGKIAGMSVVGTGHTPWTYSDDDFYGADLYILIGSNMFSTRPVSFSILLENKTLNNSKIICIDPRRSQSAEKADKWISIKPGTDMALALGMIYYILSKRMEDRDFVQKYTTGFDEFKRYVLERNYNLDWASNITGIPSQEIKSLTELYVRTKKAIIVGNSGLSHHTNAVQTHRCFYFLAAITGHFGEKAMGYSCLNNGGISLGKLSLPSSLPKSRPALGKNPVAWLESLENPVYPYQLKALICTGSPLSQWPDQRRIRTLISKLELSVYIGLTPNINAYYFDYILPAAPWLESGGVAPVSDDSRFVWVPKVLNSPGEAKPDRWWWIELGKRMGWEDVFRDELKDPEKLQNIVGAQKAYTMKLFFGKKDHAIHAPISIKNGKVKERSTLFLDKKFPTPSGKIEFWSKELEKKFEVYGMNVFPDFYMDPDIADKDVYTISAIKKLILSPFQKNKTYTFPVKITRVTNKNNYSFFLITGRPSSAIMGHSSHWIKKLNNISPDQFCLIHPYEAEKLDIKDGSIVLISSPYGQAPALVYITEYIRKDTVFVPYSYAKKAPFTSWKSINFVTNLEARCPISGQIAFKGIKVNINKQTYF